MSYLDRSIKHQPPEYRSHKQGRFVLTAEGYLEWQSGDQIDLHNLLTEHKQSVNLTRMETGILRTSGVLAGSILVVDKSKQPQSGNMVYVRYNGDLVIRRLVKENNGWVLRSDDPREPVLPVNSYVEIEKLGVVTWALNKLY